MTDEPIPTTDHEYMVMVAMLVLSIVWPFFDPFHRHHDTVMYWVWNAPVFICGALLLAQSVVGAVLRRRERSGR